MTAVHVEPLAERHSQQAGDLVRRILRDEFGAALTVCADADLDAMYQSYSAPARAAWVTLSDGAVVGVIALKDTPAGSLEMRRFYVDAEWRGRGIAAQLLDAAHAWAERETFQEITLTTTGLMGRARSFYARHGYEESGTTNVDGVTLHNFRRVSGLRPIGSRRSVGAIPRVSGRDLAVVVERPRRLLEGWHWSGSEFVLYAHYPRPFPVNYGFIAGTMNPADGDELDAIVLDDRRMAPGEVVVCRAVGVAFRADGDHKLLVMPIDAGPMSVELDEAFRERVSSWFDDVALRPIGWGDAEEAGRVVDRCQQSEAVDHNGT